MADRQDDRVEESMDEADRRNGEGPDNPIDAAFDDAPDLESGGALGTAAAAPTTPTIPAAMSPHDGGGGDPGPEEAD